MKKIFLLSSLFAIVVITACSSDDGHVDNQDTYRRGNNTPASDYFEYTIDVTSPNALDKSLDDEISINIDFKSTTGKTVHYTEVRIFSKLDSTEVFDGPANNHVDDDSGSYNFSDTFTLSKLNGFTVGTDWILEAKVWGTNPSEDDVVTSLGFHIGS